MRLSSRVDFQSFVDKKSYKAICQTSFLSYYIALSVYAVINLYTLFFGVLNFSNGLSLLLSLAGMFCAIVNELIDLQMVTNPKGKDKKSKHGTFLKFFIDASISVVLFFALIDVYTGIANMTTIQQNTLLKMGVRLPVFIVATYNCYFILTGLIAKSMTYLTNFVNYIYGTRLQKHEMKKNQKPNSGKFSQWLGGYIKNPVSMTMGVTIGAFLYAYGDYQILCGLLLILSQMSIINISHSFVITSALLCAANTFFERILLWGHNFRRFQNENKNIFNKDGYLFQWIPKNPLLRKLLSQMRIAILAVRGIMNSFVYFTGWKKYLGFLSTLSYVSATYVQNSLQISNNAVDQPAKHKKIEAFDQRQGDNCYTKMSKTG